jgi:hypothetical protein
VPAPAQGARQTRLLLNFIGETARANPTGMPAIHRADFGNAPNRACLDGRVGKARSIGTSKGVLRLSLYDRPATNGSLKSKENRSVQQAQKRKCWPLQTNGLPN